MRFWARKRRQIEEDRREIEANRQDIEGVKPIAAAAIERTNESFVRTENMTREAHDIAESLIRDLDRGINGVRSD